MISFLSKLRNLKKNMDLKKKKNRSKESVCEQDWAFHQKIILGAASWRHAGQDCHLTFMLTPASTSLAWTFYTKYPFRRHTTCSSQVVFWPSGKPKWQKASRARSEERIFQVEWTATLQATWHELGWSWGRQESLCWSSVSARCMVQSTCSWTQALWTREGVWMYPVCR